MIEAIDRVRGGRDASVGVRRARAHAFRSARGGCGLMERLPLQRKSRQNWKSRERERERESCKSRNSFIEAQEAHARVIEAIDTVRGGRDACVGVS